MFRRIMLALAILGPIVGAAVGQAQERRSRWDPAEFLQRLDRNGNGTLEPDEMVGRAKGFVEGLGIDTSQPVSIDSILSAIDRQRQEADTERSKKEAEQAANADWSNPRLVPGFGEESSAATVLGFGTGESDPAAASSLAGQDAVNEAVREQVDRVLDQYDRNDDEVLDADEIRNTPWGQPRPEESDANGDGRLTREELVERYRKRDADNARMNGNDERRSSQDESRNESRGDSGDRRSERSRSRASSESSPSPERSSPASQLASTRSSSNEERIEGYVQDLLGRYDSNHDGSLSSEEQSAMSAAPKSGDVDSNGLLSRDELISYYGGGYRQSGSPAANASGENSDANDGGDSSSRERRRESRRDRDSTSSGSSGQRPVKMHEFTDAWTDEKLNEFRELDQNNDGVISVEEFRRRK